MISEVGVLWLVLAIILALLALGPSGRAMG